MIEAVDDRGIHIGLSRAGKEHPVGAAGKVALGVGAGGEAAAAFKH